MCVKIFACLCFRNIHDQAVLYCVCASLIELTRETGRVDVLRAVNSGGTVAGKVIDSLVSKCTGLQNSSCNM